MKKEIQIHVVGRAGTGKTTIAELLQELLINEGFNSTYIEFEKLHETFNDNKEQRQKVIKNSVDITITEIQARPW